MLHKNHISSIKDYSKMIGTLLKISCFYISPDFKPEGHFVSILCPIEIHENINHILFGGLLNTIDVNTIYSVYDTYNLRYCVVKLDNNDGFFTVGPFLNAKPSSETITHILEKNNISMDNQEAFKAYYEELTYITFEELYHVFNYLIHTYYCPDMKVIPIKPLHINNKVLENLLLYKEPSEEMLSDVIQQRYEAENLLLTYVSQGNLEAAANLINIPYNINKYPNTITTKKNFLIIENTLFRIAIQKSGVHPNYIDHLNNSYMHRILMVKTIEEANILKFEMLVDYCNLAKMDSTLNYSPIIREAIHFINLNINKAITLSTIASNIAVSAQYLSTLFKQEVGTSLTEFISKKRMDQAAYFLKESTLSISEISTQVGYSDLNYFSKVFKKYYKVTPSSYRNGS